MKSILDNRPELAKEVNKVAEVATDIPLGGDSRYSSL